jgi:hypothetical protein
MTELKKEAYSQLTKEQLIRIIDQWESCCDAIMQTTVDKSKSLITAERACADINRYMSLNKAISIDYLRPKHLKAEIDFQLGNIDITECRKRLGLE